VKWVLRLIDVVDSFGITFLHEIDLGPVVSSLSISSRFVLLHPLAAFFLSVALDLALDLANLVFAIPVTVASASGVAGSSA
jgi:hypothetical protein